jgi:hypothetical protein
VPQTRDHSLNSRNCFLVSDTEVSRWCGWLRNYARSRKGHWIFPLTSPSSCTLALGLTQPLTEMSTRNIPGEAWQPHPHLCANCLDHVGSSTSHNTIGLHSLLWGWLSFAQRFSLFFKATVILKSSSDLQSVFIQVGCWGFFLIILVRWCLKTQDETNFWPCMNRALQQVWLEHCWRYEPETATPYRETLQRSWGW